MPIFDYTFNSGPSGNPTTKIPPGKITGDFLVLWVFQDGAGTFTAPTGWTERIDTQGNGTAIAVYTKTAVASETDPVVTPSVTTEEWGAVCFSIHDVHATPWDTSATATHSSATSSHQFPALTTTNAEELILYLGANDTGGNVRGSSFSPGLMFVDTPPAGTAQDSKVGWTIQRTAGAVGRPYINLQDNDGGTQAVVAIRLSGASVIPGYSELATPPTTIVHPMRDVGTSSSVYGGGAVDPTADIASIDSITVNYATSIISGRNSATNFNDGGLVCQGSNSAGDAQQFWGFVWDLSVANVDLSGKVVTMHYGVFGKAVLVSYDTALNGGLVFGFRSGAGPTYGYRYWKVGGKDTSPSLGITHAIAVEVDDTDGLAYTDVGTFDSTDVSGLFFAQKKINTVVALRVICTDCQILNDVLIKGGSTTRPATFADHVSTVRSSGALTILNQSGSTQKQLYSFHRLLVGDGGQVDFQDSNFNIEFPRQADIDNLNLQYSATSNLVGVTLYGVSGNTIKLNNGSISGTFAWDFIIHASSTSAATWDLTGLVIIGADVVLQDVFTAAIGISFINCATFTHNGADLSGGCTFDNTQITINGATQVALQALLDGFANAGMSNAATAFRVEYTGTGDISLDFDGMSWTGNTVDIHYNSTNASQLTAVMDNGSDATTTAISGAATGVTISAPTTDLTVTSSEAGSLIQIFTSGTQTLIDSTTGTSLVYTYTGTPTYDIVVQKAGFLPQRLAGQLMSGADEARPFTLVDDYIYDSGHGLIYTTDLSYNRATKELTIVNRNAGRDLYSALIDAFIAQTALYNTAFDFLAVGPDSFFFINDAEIIDATSEDKWHEAGIRYLSTAGATTAEWASVKSSGTVPAGATGEYQQVDGSGTTDARATGAFDQIIKIYGDATHGNFDYRAHLILKYQINGYQEVRVDVLAAAGVTALEPFEYSVAMEPAAITAAIGDPAITITVTDNGATPETLEGKSWSIKITDSATPSTAEAILRELNYNLSLDATYQGKDPFNWPPMTVEEGSNYATARGYTEGAQSTTLKGVFVAENDGTTPHSGFARMQADDGTYYVPPSTYSLTLSNLVAGSHVYIFDTGTQTVLDSTVSSGTSFTYSGAYTADQTVDYTVIQAGYIPIRATGVVVSDSPIIQSQNMIEDRAYQTASGLTFGTTATVNTGTSRFALTVASTVQNWYSFMVESWRDQATLRNTAFPLSTNGPNSFSLNDGWEWDASTSIDNLSRDGFRYVDLTDVVTASWCAILSQGEATGMQAEYQQVDGSGTTDTLATGVIDQCIQIYGDLTHGNFDYTGHLVCKIQNNGHEQARADVVATYGTLEDQFYVIALEPKEISGMTTGDPVITGVSITDHGATPVTWQTKAFSITIDDTGTNSGEDIQRWINYYLSLDATFQTKDPFNWHEMVIDNGAGYETQYGPLEGDTGATLKGVRVLRNGTDTHPDFDRFQADDGTYYTPPVTAGVSAPNLTAGRIQLYNVTTATEIENATITSGYSRNWTDGTDFTAGDVMRLRWAAAGSLPIEMNGVALGADDVSFLDTPVADDVYVDYGIDGSTVTEYAADYPNIQVDVTDPDNVFYLDRFYAWFKYNLALTQGITDFWGAVEAVNASNLLIHNDVVDILFDNTKVTSARQGDKILISRDDGVYPQVTVTSGGGGLGFYYTGVGYTVETGVSGLTAEESTKLLAASTFDPAADAVEGTETYDQALRLMRAALAGKVSVSGDVVTFRDAADSKNRIVSTTDENGQRTAVTVDGT